MLTGLEDNVRPAFLADYTLHLSLVRRRSLRDKTVAQVLAVLTIGRRKRLAGQGAVSSIRGEAGGCECYRTNQCIWKVHNGRGWTGWGLDRISRHASLFFWCIYQLFSILNACLLYALELSIRSGSCRCRFRDSRFHRIAYSLISFAALLGRVDIAQ